MSGSRKTASDLQTVGIDFDDNDNGQDKQVFEEDLADMEARDEAAAADQDAEGIQTDLETEAGESNKHPITVDGMNICELQRKLIGA